MRVLDCFFRNKIAFLALLFFFASCRKKIEHKEGKVIITNLDSNSYSPDKEWVRVTDEGLLNFNTLQVYNNELYVGGQFEDPANNLRLFAKLNNNDKLVAAAPQSFFGDAVYDMDIFDNQLIIGGDFFYGATNTNADLIRMNTTGTITDIPFSNTSGSRVRCIFPYQFEIYVGGKFSPSSTNSIVSSNVERLVNYIPAGTANANGEVLSLERKANNIVATGPEVGYIVWNTAGWSSMPYSGSSNLDEVYSICRESYEYYMVGNFNNGLITVKKQDDFNNWENIDVIKHVGKLSEYTKIKKVSSNLFLFGKNFKLNGSLVNSIVLFDEYDSYFFGSFQHEVRDMTYFNGTYYIATNYGVFKYI